MTDIEIPRKRTPLYRALEIMPGVLSWGLLLAPVILGLISPTAAAFFVVAYLFSWFFKALGITFRTLQGYGLMKRYIDLPWRRLNEDFADPLAAVQRMHGTLDKNQQLHRENLLRYASDEQPKMGPDEVIQVVMVATYNESYEVLEPTIQSVVDSDFDLKRQAVLQIAYEERGGDEVRRNAEELVRRFGGEFLHAEAVMHPADIPGEVRGKGGNITFAGRRLQEWLEQKGIEPERAVVTTLDADNRLHTNYLAALTYVFLAAQDRQHKSFQPIPIYTNNIWDVPAPMRIIAVANSFFGIIQSVRPHLLRNFSSHSQPMKALIDTDFWSVRTIVEDGHQFWRTYFRYDGNHDVVPVFVPIYQDAVLAEGYKRTLRAQFIQLRRWAYGASDIPYLITKGFFTKNNVPKGDLFMKTVRLLETHVSWASSSLLLSFAGWTPLLNAASDDFVVAQQLPRFISQMQTFASLGILAAIYLSLQILPPRPEHYRRTRYVWLLLQWTLVPVISVLYGSLAALNAQTRLMLGRYLGFDVTEKAVKHDSGAVPEQA